MIKTNKTKFADIFERKSVNKHKKRRKMKMSTGTPILITVPKYVTIPNKNGIPICMDDSGDEMLSRGKKRRLDHLSWEEKLQRK